MPPAGICAGGYERSQFLLRLAILSEGVHRFDGTINQFTGDGIMALFGAPIAHEDHARRACYAALHLKKELRRYAEELKRTRELSWPCAVEPVKILEEDHRGLAR